MVDAVGLVRRLENENPGLVSILGPADDGLITAAELRLGVRFPPAYRAFMANFGAVEIGSRQVYGLGTSLDTVDGLNLVWHTEQARDQRRLGHGELVLSSWDDLTLEVARVVDDAGETIDGAIREILVEGSGEHLASSFAEWLDRTIREVREDAGR